MSQRSRSVSLSSPLGWVAALVLALLAVFGLAIAAPGLESGAYVPDEPGPADVVTVPNVLGDRAGSAMQQLQQRGFEVSVTPVQDDAARGVVIGQSPRAETGAAEGSTVHLTVSAGRQASPPDLQLTTVPEVVGASIEEAGDRIEGENLDWQVVDDERLTPWPAGTVVDCEPGEGASVEEGATVGLFVASGRNVVPNVVGLTQEAAEQRMRDEGFDVHITESETNQTEPGLVSGQSEFAGTSMEVGSNIELTVAISPSPTITESPTTETPTPSPTETPTPSPSPALTITPAPSATP